MTELTRPIDPAAVPPRPDVAGIALCWHVDDPRRFRRRIDTDLVPSLRAGHADGRIAAVLPFHHRALTLPEHGRQRWSACVLVVCAEGVDARPDATALARAARKGPEREARLVAVDRLMLQPGLDRMYPVRGGPQHEGRLVQFIEYVISDPRYRRAYYEQQYVFSGPAMAALHRADRCGRFIGFEVDERIDGVEEMPAWDVLHVSGFTIRQMLRAVPHFRSTWQAQARTAFGPDADARHIMGPEWDRARVRASARARQWMAGTLQGR